jgi:hypothetical protein
MIFSENRCPLFRIMLLRAQFAKARMCARRNARQASARQRAVSPFVTENETKSLRQRAKKFFRGTRVVSGNFARSAVSLAMIRKMVGSNGPSLRGASKG